MLRVSLVTVLAREMPSKTCYSRPDFGEGASVAGPDNGVSSRNAIEAFLKSTQLWRCCECRYM